MARNDSFSFGSFYKPVSTQKKKKKNLSLCVGRVLSLPNPDLSKAGLFGLQGYLC